jgi:hypothetical protein
MKTLTLLAIIFITTLLFPQPAAAAEIRHAERAVVKADEVIDDDLFIAGEAVIIKGRVNGNLFVSGGIVTIDGAIQKDIYAAAGQITVSGSIGDDAVIAGGEINLKSATIGQSLIIAGGQVIIDPGSVINDSLIFAAGDFNSQAQVGNSVMGGGGLVTYGGSLNKPSYIGAGELVLTNNSHINADLTYSADQEVTIDQGASVSAQLKRVNPGVDRQFDQEIARWLSGVWLTVTIISYIAALLVGILLLYFLPKTSQSIAEQIDQKPLSSFVYGLLLVILIPIFIITVMITIVGFPLGLIVAAGFFLVIYLARIYMAIVIGNRLFSQTRLNPSLLLALGLAVLYAATVIPFVGGILKIIIICLTLGAVFRHIFSQQLDAISAAGKKPPRKPSSQSKRISS